MKKFASLPFILAGTLLVCTLTTHASLRRSSISSTTEFGFSGKAGVSQGTVALGETDTLFTRLRLMQSVPVNQSYSWRIGAEWERIGFGIPVGAPLPNTVQSVELRLGNTWRLNRRSMLQFDISPGVYSDFEDLDFGDMNAPIAARYIFLQSTNVQWVIAAIADPKNEIPVVGGVGLRWRFAPQWTLDLIMPRPQLRFEVNTDLTLHAGGGLRGGAYRVAENFGTRVGRPELNDEDLTYREIRVGGGFNWKINNRFSTLMDAGWVIDRRFAFKDARLQLNGKGAPYFQLSVSAKF